MQRTNFLELKYGSGKVIEPFLRRLFTEKNPKMVYWVSPWLSHLTFRTATTKKLLQKLQMHQVPVILITREPEPGSPHEEFIKDVKKLPTASIFYMSTLHAKFYIAVTNERRYALLGSANMYEWSNSSFELGVVIESRGEGEVLVNQLEDLVHELRLIRNTKKA